MQQGAVITVTIRTPSVQSGSLRPGLRRVASRTASRTRAHECTRQGSCGRLVAVPSATSTSAGEACVWSTLNPSRGRARGLGLGSAPPSHGPRTAA
eukprot:1518723-Prymnesium_polylepis.1